MHRSYVIWMFITLASDYQICMINQPPHPSYTCLGRDPTVTFTVYFSSTAAPLRYSDRVESHSTPLWPRGLRAPLEGCKSKAQGLLDWQDVQVNGQTCCS